VKKTTIVSFPFDLFGSGGSAAGAQLLADELREVLADNRRETVPTRARAYTPHVRLRELSFDTVERYRRWRELGRQAARRSLHGGEFLVWLAGNHLGVLPVYDELARLDPPPLVVQLDAHLDIHHFGDCAKEPSHGNFLLHCAGPLPPLVNVGHRDLLLTPEHVRRYYRATFSAAELAVRPAPILAELRELAGRAERVYLDLDCDVFDAAYFPAVAEPVPFGLSPAAVLQVVEAVGPERLGGAVVSELDPGRDANDRSLAALMWLIEYLLLRRYE
jgi:agmatinase